MGEGILFLILTVFVFGAQGTTQCPAIEETKWGQIRCTDEDMAGSVCNLSCDEHYDLAGTTDASIEVTCGEDGMWSKSTDFTCVPIRCVPELRAPYNGDLICSANNLAQSLCVFFCKEHYDMKDIDFDRTSYTICRDDGNGDEFGNWSVVDEGVVYPPAFPPVCEAVKCPNLAVAPENGKVDCSDADLSGSTCVFYCNVGYRFEGSGDAVVFSNCKDDGNFDSVGNWTMPDIPRCKKASLTPNCGPPPSVSKITFTCDSDDYVPGTTCEAKCTSHTEDINGDSTIICNADKRWQAEIFPRCIQCKRAKSLEILALIHDSENIDSQYDLAVKMISKVVTMLQRKYRFNPTLKVNRYSMTVNPSTEFITTDFESKRDKARIEAIPFPGQFESITKALEYIDNGLTGDDTALVAFIITNRLMDYNEDAMKLAESLKARGVTIIAFTIPQLNKALTWRKEELVSITGDESLVYHVGSPRLAEQYKSEVAMQILEASLKKGCETNGKAA